jgi:hypothetical protein
MVRIQISTTTIVENFIEVPKILKIELPYDLAIPYTQSK